jgi:hypothetical protein
VRTLSGDFDVGYVERLCENRAVHFERAEFAEVLGSDVLRRQDFFGECGGGAGVVVLRGCDLRERRFPHQQREQADQLDAGVFHSSDAHHFTRPISVLNLTQQCSL